tara:strand:+ start:35 stop:283 length:249 start_codon:yes stop_codon:yes gene_type:complete
MTKLQDFTIEELMIFCATILGSCGLLLKVIFTSKCEEIGCGPCKIRRNIEAIIQEERLEKTGHTGNTPRLDLDLKEPETENP